MTSSNVVLCSAARTAIGTYGGAPQDIAAPDLGAAAIRASVERAKLKGSDVGTVVTGQVVQAGAKMNPARQAAITAGIPVDVPAMTVNRVCGSGAQAIATAAQEVMLGFVDCAIAGGMENMDQSPYLMSGGRWGYRMGDAQIHDSMLRDGLNHAFCDKHSGWVTEDLVSKSQITREAQDRWACLSQTRFSKAQAAQKFQAEIVPVEVPSRKGPSAFTKDEHNRSDTTQESRAKLKPAFRKDGTVTAGNASGLNSGAAAMIVADAGWAEKHSLAPMARLVAYGVGAVEPGMFGLGPAARQALERAGWKLAEVERLWLVCGLDIRASLQPVRQLAKLMEHALAKAQRRTSDPSALHTPVAACAVAKPEEHQTAAGGSFPTTESPRLGPQPSGPPAEIKTDSLQDLFDYQRDLLERTILFWDTLRQRADNMLEHERAGLPPLIDLKYETLLDARRFEHPANYALLRITEVGEDCWDNYVDIEKPPVIIVDPRAGHGPGIGGFKRESEVGMAMRESHPVYFVIFFPQPAPEQTLADVLHALRRFVAEVARRHPGKPPVLYGNCQAGWAVTLLPADCEGLFGPAVLNGSPLSYWVGESGVNPMRVAGGLLGGAWLAHLTADLGGGRFDGAWLAQNFENLQSEKAIWEKYAHLFTNVDSERERFLEFERWWNGYYFLSREEILTNVENLFIGNQLEQGLLRICEGCIADLRRISNPLVIFVSYGDNITPPHQALGWIPAVYTDTEDLKRAGQRIVYMTNPHVGHLGIFVSASVARLEHRAILESLAEIEALAPGLYEMKIDNPSGDPDCHRPSYSVHFEPRKVEDLKRDYPREAFESVRKLSEFNETLYRTFASPWVQMIAAPWTAELLKWLHPMRTSRYLLSEAFNPWMRGVSLLASRTAKNRSPLAQDQPFVVQERKAAADMTEVLGSVRKVRDALYERTFSALFEGLGAWDAKHE
jgi:acetyl-CoA acetyltransferase family protein